jgi:hypothetical protein
LKWSCSAMYMEQLWCISLKKREADASVLIVKPTRCTNFSNLFFYYLFIVPSWSCSQAVSKPAWHIPWLCVQWKTPDDGQRNCPKPVEFYSKNKFEELVHLVRFIIRIYHNSRSPERQIRNESEYIVLSCSNKLPFKLKNAVCTFCLCVLSIEVARFTTFGV